ncbi:MAG: helix-turn-helix domain-containing protein [Bacteroidaceae bacterium]|nr:helix-turn-helix domain-containing protein [Bacteroidaceae bacterium]
MKDRILQLMQKEQMAQKEFAVYIGVSPSTMSNILNGKSEVSQKVISCIHQRYPRISIPWLMFGEGEMYYSDIVAPNSPVESLHALPFHEEESSELKGSSSMIPKSNLSESDVSGLPVSGIHTPAAHSQKIIETIKYIDKPQKYITEIRIFYSDGTYESFQRNDS